VGIKEKKGMSKKKPNGLLSTFARPLAREKRTEKEVALGGGRNKGKSDYIKAQVGRSSNSNST